MANRYQQGTRNWIYRFLVERDGELCLCCYGEHGLIRKPPKIRLDIDHADGNCLNDDPNNLGLLCNGCNNKMRRQTSVDHKKLIEKYRATVLAAREREKNGGATETNKLLIDYNCGSVQMQANNLLEIQYRDFVINRVKARGSYPTKEAINSGAEVVGFSPQTARRYLDKLISEDGALTEIMDSTRRNVLVFKMLPNDAKPNK